MPSNYTPKHLLAAILLMLLPLAAHAAEIVPALDGTWKVTGSAAPGISAMDDKEIKSYMGKELVLYKGYLTSPFGNCEGCGLTMGYKKRNVEEMVAEDPQTYSGLKFPNSTVLEHTISWGNESVTMLQIDNRTAYVEKDGVFFILKKSNR